MNPLKSQRCDLVIGALASGLLCLVSSVILAQEVQPFPVPTASADESRALAPEVLLTMADRQAREVWGTAVSGGGNPVSLAGPDGSVRAYLFSYRLDGGEPPSQEEIFTVLRALRAELAIRPGEDGRLIYPPDFYAALERRLGRLGAVMVAATRDDFPILSVHHSLHPHFLYAEATVDVARRLLSDETLMLHRAYFLGPHELHYGFRSQDGKEVAIHAYSMQPAAAEEVFAADKWGPLDPTLFELRDRAWREMSDGAPRLIPGSEVGMPHTLKLIQHYKLVPVVDWTHWCVPTAMTMTAGFWDNYIKGTGTVAGFGRLIDFWLVNGQGNNVPNFIDEIIDPATGTWSSQGFLGTVNNTNGYNFTWNQVRTGPSNDWAWADLKTEIDAGRPAMWSVVGVHSMTAIGYRISGSQKFAVVYNTWGTTAQAQYSEYNYNQWNGTIVSEMDVGKLHPGGGTGVNHAVLISPDGGEVLNGPTPVVWYSWGTTIARAELAASYDSGATWSTFANVPASAGWNSTTWTPTAQSANARVRVRSLTTSGGLVSADGSESDFQVGSAADLVPLNLKPEIGPLGMCRRDADGRLTVSVRNVGTVAAPASTGRVTFLVSGAQISSSLPAIPAGGTASFKATIPGACYNPDCEFRIEVDAGGQVNEAYESNNSVVAWCIS